MTVDPLKQNLQHIKEIIRELYVFTNQLDMIKNLESDKRVVINTQEKKLLNEVIIALTIQLRILNKSLPDLVNKIGFYKRLIKEGEPGIQKKEEKLVQVKYSPGADKEKISITIGDKDKKEFLENLSRSNLSINQLKRKYSVERVVTEFGKPNAYAKLSNHFFRNISNSLIAKGYFNSLNKNLRKINSPFVLGTYVSIILFSMLISFIFSFLLFVILLFFKISIIFPFLNPVEVSIIIRFLQVFWVIFLIPLITGLFIYVYPSSESKSIGERINQELPFVVIHMSAIATSGVDPLSIFKIILRGGEYKYTKVELRKLMNLINFHGKDLVTALKETSRSCPSIRLKELLNGLSTTITSGGDIHDFLDQHAESILFDYKLERERYIKTSETFMDIYISVVIAAPMILLILFVIMGSTGTLGGFLNLPVSIIGLLIVLVIAALNVIFLVFLKLKQPTI